MGEHAARERCAQRRGLLAQSELAGEHRLGAAGIDGVTGGKLRPLLVRRCTAWSSISSSLISVRMIALARKDRATWACRRRRPGGTCVRRGRMAARRSGTGSTLPAAARPDRWYMKEKFRFTPWLARRSGLGAGRWRGCRSQARRSGRRRTRNRIVVSGWSIHRW